MNCMKCGIEMKQSGVFCEDCLAEMEKYPVKPNITIQLPVRPATIPGKKRVRRQRHIKPEDQIRHLKQVRNILCGLLVFVLLAFAALTVAALHMLGEENGFGLGQNYETIDSTNGT